MPMDKYIFVLYISRNIWILELLAKQQPTKPNKEQESKQASKHVALSYVRTNDR